MTKEDFADKLRRHDAWLPGRRIKLDFGDDGMVLVDGVEGRIVEDDGPADTIVAIGWSDWLALSEGRLDPMSAYMSGRLRVRGDISDAVKLGGILQNLRAD